MSEPIDLDALEALYRDDKKRPVGTIGQADVLALIAELRQEREETGVLLDKAGEIAHQNQNLVQVRLELEAALSRAEETIEKVQEYADRKGTFGFSELHNILAEYSRAKRGAGRD